MTTPINDPEHPANNPVSTRILLMRPASDLLTLARRRPDVPALLRRNFDSTTA
ncbi:Uncharacterised protein [Cedecea neteri]|uniref:Uncharacterized protein n=1 Tax=Cedecea neteri TaxID=158822 RepID=A0A2X3J821_9ENTR|nr:hypothetical protein [Cedecea neteri]SQC92141.1 Uncharacterised protein [Cedecea neteri]